MEFGMVIVAVMAAAIGLPIAVYLVYKLFGLIFRILGNLFTFIGNEVKDAVRLVGTVIVIPIFSLLVLLNVIIGRWSAAAHFGRSVGAECSSFGACVYRLVVGNPARLLGLGGALEGVEQRLPQAMAEAPGRDKPRRASGGKFEGYTIVGSLPGGGSGARLYIAEPDPIKRAGFDRRGMDDVRRVVIKAFSQSDGSTLDQIVRESRALEAAKELGLVLEHASEPDRFYYVMRYVPGDSLGVITQRLHAQSPSAGLDARHLRMALSYIADLVDSLHVYHRGGLWHKDVKPDNIIIDRADDRAHLVDFGLVTPMRSAMTLTTHGTEYFRDPELVRQALRGVKVHEIDGAKFDVYSAGAVLYSVVENSFPAHGGLSQISKRCPEALKWIVRRSMADYQRRYASAAEMRADLQAVIEARDPFALKPVDLPSMRGGEPPVQDAPELTPDPVAQAPNPEPARSPFPPAGAYAGAGVGVGMGAGHATPRRGRPKLRVSDWWSGRYTTEAGVAPAESAFDQAGEKLRTAWGAAQEKLQQAGVRAPESVEARRTPAVPVGQRLSAEEQLRNARDRVRRRRADARQRATNRRHAVHRRPRRKQSAGGLAGLVFGLFLALSLFLAFAVVVGALLWTKQSSRSSYDIVVPDDKDWSAEVWSPEKWETDGLASERDFPELSERVLVLSDLASPLDPDARARLERVLGGLSSAGARFTGEFVTSVDETDGALVDRIARVRAQRGAVPLDSDDLGSRLAATLAWPDADFDAVLWLAPVAGEPGAVELVLIDSDGVSRADASSEAEVRRLVEDLSEPGL
ncbi:MAG: serine/threonine protein kinase [Phycisphaerales bacterium JB040]